MLFEEARTVRIEFCGYIFFYIFRGTSGKVLDSLMLVYLVLVAAGCCIYYAFRTRNLPANFNKAKYISFSLLIYSCYPG